MRTTPAPAQKQPETLQARQSKPVRWDDMYTEPIADEPEAPKKDSTEMEYFWTTKCRDAILDSFLRFGFGRWKEIAQYSCCNIATKMVQDACTVFVYLISQGVPNTNEFILQVTKNEKFQLTSVQRQLTVQDAFSNDFFIKSFFRDADDNCTRLCQLNELKQWHENNEPVIVFDDTHKPVGEWNYEMDKKLLSLTFKHGYGNWKAIIKDPLWQPAKLTSYNASEINNRLSFLLESLLTKNTTFSLACVDKSSDISLPDMRPEEIRLLMTLLKNIGFPDESDTESWQRYTNFFEGLEHAGNLKNKKSTDVIPRTVKKVIECLRALAYMNPSTPKDALGRSMNSILPNSEQLLTVFNSENAFMIKTNIDWVARLREYVNTVLPTNEEKILADVKQVELPPNVPPQWIEGKNDIQLIKNVGRYHFTKLYDIALVDMANQLTKQDLSKLRNMAKYFEDYGVNKRVAGYISFFTDPEQVMNKIEQFIQRNGGWQVPRIIDVPLGKEHFIELPYTDNGSSLIVESTGNGEFFLYGEYLCRVGMKTFAMIEDEKYQCEIPEKDKFSVTFKKRTFVGDTPKEAFSQINEDFNEKGESTLEFCFGFRSSQVISFFDKECSREKREELGLTEYVKPRFLLFKSE